MDQYKKFKKKHRGIHLLLVAIAIVMFWRGVWDLLDEYLLPNWPLMSSVVSILVAFLVLYLDDFHLKELE